MAYFCYLLKCTNGAYYTGWSTDPYRRLQQHNNGKGARYVKLNGPAQLVYIEEVENHIAALKRELEIKKWTHAKKQKFVETATNNLLINT